MGKGFIFDGFRPHFSAKNMFFLASSFWAFIWSCIIHVSCFIFSLKGKSFKEVGSNFDGVCESQDEGIVGKESDHMGCDQIEMIEDHKLDSEVGSVSNASTSKYQFISGNSVCAFVEEPQIMSFSVQEMFVTSNDEPSYEKDFVEDRVVSDLVDVSFSHDKGVDHSLEEHSDCVELSGEQEVVKQGKTENPVCDLLCQVELEDATGFTEHEPYENEETCSVSDQVQVEVRNQLCLSDSDDFWASIHKYDVYSVSNHNSDCGSDEMLWEKSPSEGSEPDTPMGIGDKRVDYDEDSPRSSDDFSLEQDNPELVDVNVESDNENADAQYIEIEPQPRNSIPRFVEHIQSDEFSDSDDEVDQENSTFDSSKVVDASESSDEEDDQGEMDVLLEQKELIRQMKREMRNLKISGLPTILEESESPRVEDDLRPLKIDQRIGHKDRMDEIQTLYKKYLDKMRKLDILSQQTMYAIGLLQLKYQDQFASNKKASVPVIKSLLAQNFWSYKLRKHEADPVQKLIKDFQRDLELVYVGQLCLSWEMLKWQHHKAVELHSHDPEGFRQHNQVAGDFQKFQVLLQRFTEDEPFHHGPRVQHYVKSRCNLPNLLQLPLIKDDPRSEWRGKGESGISVGMLKEVIGASMHAFWNFLRADKEEVHAMTLMGIHGIHVDLKNPSDTNLLSEIRSNLLKKEKRLKDLVRSGNCIVKKFQKHQDHRLSHEMFLAQVELRLVSRVLHMSRLTTDQLLWCQRKVSKINIVGRKVYLDSSFLLFPC